MRERALELHPLGHAAAGRALEPRIVLRRAREVVLEQLNGSSWKKVGTAKQEKSGDANFRDPAATSLLFNFDGTIRSGLGDPRQVQAGLRWIF